MTGTGKLPVWLPIMNRLVKTLNKLGMKMDTIHVLTIIGRKSGEPRSTPVSPLTVDGHRYVIAGLNKASWAANARAAGEGTVGYGRTVTPIRLTEVTDPALKRRVMRAFPTEVPHGVMFFQKLGIVTNPTPDEFEAAADNVAVFEIHAIN